MEPPLTTLVVSPEAVTGIETRLKQLVREANATCALLLDHSGQVISTFGDIGERELVPLGALIAGNFASAREIARLLKEPQFRLSFQQGEKEHVLTAMVGGRCLLSVLFRVNGQLGLVKVLTDRASEDLAVVVEASSRQTMASRTGTPSFRQAADLGIDRWFREQSDERLG